MFLLKPIKFGNFEISPLVIILFGLAYFFDFTDKLILTYIFACLHEFAHVTTAYITGAKILKIQILPFGVNMNIMPSEIKSSKQEILIASAGPIFSFFMGCLFFYTDQTYSSAVNFSIFIINVIPALPLDGGRVLKAILTEKYGHIKAFNILMTVTKILSIILITLGIVILFITKFNFSVVLIGCFLVVNCISEQRGRHIKIMDEILKSREKIIDENVLRTEYITIKSDEPAFRALKMLSKNKYYFINIVDDSTNIISTVSETILIESLIAKGIRIKAYETVDFNTLKCYT